MTENVEKKCLDIPFKLGGFAGRAGVGKTLVCADLLVMAHDSGVRTEDLLFFDCEGGVELYTKNEYYRNKFLVVDTSDEVVFNDWCEKLIKEDKKYKVIVIDPIEMLQDRFIENVWEDPSLTKEYKEKNISFMWGRVKKGLGKFLLSVVAKKCDTLLVTSHARREFVGKVPSGRWEAKFLEPIWYLASFIGFMQRDPNKRLPDVYFNPPLGKSRILALPPKIEEFTWTKMFKYIGETPADWKNLKKEEMADEGLKLLEKIAEISKGGVETEEI